MSTYQRILVVLGRDHSLHEAALNLTSRIAASDASVHVMVPVYDPAARIAELVQDGSAEQIRQTCIDGNRHVADKAIAQLTSLGIPTAGGVHWDRRADLAVLEAAHRGHSDLIIKTAPNPEHRPDIEDRNVLRSCVCPLYLVREERRELPGNIVAAVDLVRDDTRHANLNRCVLKHSGELAAAFGSAIHLISAFPPLTTALPLMENFAEAESLHREIEARYKARGATLLETCRLPGVVNIEEGSPGKVIAGVAAKLTGTVIVCGTIARTGIAGIAVGNTVERILELTGNDVFCVKGENLVVPSELDREMGRV